MGKPGELVARWLESLPFEPTAGQLAAFDEIDADLDSGEPMQRLLMGEVGSGKTVVALYAMLRALEAGHQAVLMAPTETLAEQHAVDPRPPARRGADPVRAADRRDAGASTRKQALNQLASGELGLILGTHALIEPSVALRPARRLRRRRAAPLRGRAAAGARRQGARGAGAPRPPHDRDADPPHALADRLRRPRHDGAARAAGRAQPGGDAAGRRGRRGDAFELLRAQLREGRQAFVVCPLVAESEKQQGRAAEVEAERLAAGELRGFELGVLHGQMPSAEKAAAMARFASGETQVLVATTVIEVGIDVPNATVMVIEGAERYGVSQLHQLRGRVGRGEHRSYCLLFPEDAGELARRRLKAVAGESDGFKLAEVDLRCAARARCSAPASTACRASPSPSSPRTRRCCSRRARRCSPCCASTARSTPPPSAR